MTYKGNKMFQANNFIHSKSIEYYNTKYGYKYFGKNILFQMLCNAILYQYHYTRLKYFLILSNYIKIIVYSSFKWIKNE